MRGSAFLKGPYERAALRGSWKDGIPKSVLGMIFSKRASCGRGALRLLLPYRRGALWMFDRDLLWKFDRAYAVLGCTDEWWVPQAPATLGPGPPGEANRRGGQCRCRDWKRHARHVTWLSVAAAQDDDRGWGGCDDVRTKPYCSPLTGEPRHRSAQCRSVTDDAGGVGRALGESAEREAACCKAPA